MGSKSFKVLSTLVDRTETSNILFVIYFSSLGLTDPNASITTGITLDFTLHICSSSAPGAFQFSCVFEPRTMIFKS